MYQHATARVRAWLTDNAGGANADADVTAQSTMTSNQAAIVRVPSSADTRMEALAAGSATIDAAFGATSSGQASATLTVDDTPVTAASLSWSVNGIAAESTVKGEADSTHAVTVNVQWSVADGQSGAMAYNDIGASASFTQFADGSSYLDISQLVSFSSPKTDVLEVDAFGTVTLKDNWHETVALVATIGCAEQGAAVSSELVVYANLDPGQARSEPLPRHAQLALAPGRFPMCRAAALSVPALALGVRRSTSTWESPRAGSSATRAAPPPWPSESTCAATTCTPSRRCRSSPSPFRAPSLPQGRLGTLPMTAPTRVGASRH